MSKRTIPVGLHPERLGRPIYGSSFHYLVGRYNHSDDWSDTLLVDVEEACRELHIKDLDRRIFLAKFELRESVRRIAQRYHVSPTTVQESLRRTEPLIWHHPSFGWLLAFWEDHGEDTKAVGEIIFG